jgi:hypothetical protein
LWLTFAASVAAAKQDEEARRRLAEEDHTLGKLSGHKTTPSVTWKPTETE